MLYDPKWQRSTNLLDQAADLLEERGFCKGTLYDGDGQMCVLGAIHKAVGVFAADAVTPDDDLLALQKKWDAVAHVLEHLGKILFGPDASMEQIFMWNDDPDQTQQGVVEALRHAAATLPADAEPKNTWWFPSNADALVSWTA